MPMKWSKLKAHVEGLFADGVRGRVRLHTTHYRGGASMINGFERRSWITIDGRPILNMHRWLHEGDVYVDYGDDARCYALGLYNSWDMQMACERYLTMSIDDALATENTLIRAFAVLDRRTGRRRLRELRRGQEIPLVRYLMAFRRAANVAKNKAGESSLAEKCLFSPPMPTGNWAERFKTIGTSATINAPPAHRGR